MERAMLDVGETNAYCAGYRDCLARERDERERLVRAAKKLLAAWGRVEPIPAAELRAALEEVEK